MTDHVPGKPRIGAIVHYYNAKILTRIGFTTGYGGRAEGPYAAIVTNNLGNGLELLVLFPGITPLGLSDVIHKDDTASGHDSQGNPNSERGYWDWASSLDAARAAKEVKPDAGSAD